MKKRGMFLLLIGAILILLGLISCCEIVNNQSIADTTKVECLWCDDTGIIECDHRCLVCYGEGYCLRCASTQFIRCSKCHGSGRYLNEYNYKYYWCNECSGSGFVECDKCSSGRCETCDGKGRYINKNDDFCEKCSNTGFRRCPYCANS